MKAFSNHTLTKEIWVETNELGPFSFLSTSVLSARRKRYFGETRRKDSKHTVLDRLVILSIRAKPRGSQNITKSGCKRSQENLNHKQMHVLPKSLVLHWANLTKQLYENSTANPHSREEGMNPASQRVPLRKSKAR